MRCDNCPLCPTAEDDVCAIAESKEWGIEHKDGMMGCRHPRNWCEKKADEYAEYLGEMGTRMAQSMEDEHRGYMDAVGKAKCALAELLLCADSPDYSFDHGHWELCFTVLARDLHFTDTEIYEIADRMKAGEQDG